MTWQRIDFWEEASLNAGISSPNFVTQAGDLLYIAVYSSNPSIDWPTTKAGYTVSEYGFGARTYTKTADGTETSFFVEADPVTPGQQLLMAGAIFRDDAGRTATDHGWFGGGWSHPSGSGIASQPANEWMMQDLIDNIGEPGDLFIGVLAVVDTGSMDFGSFLVIDMATESSPGAIAAYEDFPTGFSQGASSLWLLWYEDATPPSGGNLWVDPEGSLVGGGPSWSGGLLSHLFESSSVAAPPEDITHQKVDKRRVTAKQLPYLLDTGLLGREM